MRADVLVMRLCGKFPSLRERGSEHELARSERHSDSDSEPWLANNRDVTGVRPAGLYLSQATTREARLQSKRATDRNHRAPQSASTWLLSLERRHAKQRDREQRQGRVSRPSNPCDSAQT
ncbi:hypothetical protein AAFF_G00184830 [Aldrovandia affinis]|uniref:Uncharacterized protein n=1 Tax=Aldrovandia affinis TaxID=143900 RepID=A0AAD7W7B1_9TELE|nr:hypothetical protein AAFF_G00184830 [Aldrovandia affinis]